MKDRALETQVLIIGCGVAGLSTAIALAESGVECTLITASQELEETNTAYAQGGIIYRADQFGDAEKLEHDILEAGSFANYVPAVRQLVQEGPSLVQSILIEKVGVPFDRKVPMENSSDFHLTREGGHSAPRILHKGDESGKSIQASVLAYAKTLPALKFLTSTTAVNLLMSSFHVEDRGERHQPAHCFGAFVFDQKTQEVYPILARHTLLATGGIGQLFLHNTNGAFARGDGIALAHRAGCRLENLEYVQFHPTTFYRANGPRFLISEALRGEGAILKNATGERFLSKYLPGYQIPELAPRDRVAQAIHKEMLSSGAPCVYLDISHKPSDWIRERFPFIYKSCLRQGVDITKEPIPVVPGAHYHCGGVWTDLNGQTSVSALWAAGEVACTGLHGANRLASTSLLEGLVWGTRAGKSIAMNLKKSPQRTFPQIRPWQSETATVDSSFLIQDWLTLKHTLWNYVGLIKSDQRLERAAGILNELARGIEVFYRKAALSDDLIGLRHATLVASLILDASRRNRQSLGCYLREELEI